jgi:NAD(P)-dependent dehydrogenase (short-subunit alcohol dehydrogenase family)
MQLKDRVAVITGAGRGIGYGIAERFAAAGARVIIGELNPQRGEEASAKLREQGYDAQAITLDVTQPASCAGLCEQVMYTHGRIDILVNNAGLFILHKSEEMPEQDWRLQIDVLLNGTFFMTQAVARAAMIPRRSGSIVNIASIGGMGGWPMRSAYNAAKAGVIVLSEVLATEWAQYNIRLNCISPGVTRTEMMDVAIKQGAANLALYSNRTPLGRVAEVSEIADAALFLASDRSKAITGENLRVDGGWVAWANSDGRGFPEA